MTNEPLQSASRSEAAFAGAWRARRPPVGEPASPPIVPAAEATRATADRLVRLAGPLLERGWLPDPLVRRGIRRLLAERLRSAHAGGEAAVEARLAGLVAAMRSAPVAPATAAANQQHYEVPTRFFERVLGPRLKYSSALWPDGVETLAAAEEAMLERTVREAGVADGQRLLDLGCGWGSLTFWLLERFPACTVDAVTSSLTQQVHVVAEAQRRGVSSRLRVVRGDVAQVELPAGAYDRVLSVEMFEHLRNWPRVLQRIRGWLRADGALFLHVFCHRHVAYPFEDGGAGDWMARHFFTGGLMPSFDLVERCADGYEVERSWWIPGTHYARTAAAWLRRLDRQRAEVRATLADDPAVARRRLAAWRTFFLACEELFAWEGGAQWGVAHWRLAPQRRSARRGLATARRTPHTALCTGSTSEWEGWGESRP